MKKYSNNEINKATKYFETNGYYLFKNLFPYNVVEQAASWLKSKNLEKLSKTWTEKEPGVSLAVYQNIHQNNSPISKIASNKISVAYGMPKKCGIKIS